MKRKLYCMILDDDRHIVKLLESYARMTTGLVVSHAGTDPRKALERIQRINVDILIIDMEMPELSGLDFLVQVKERVQGLVPGVSPLKVIVCTAHREYAADTFDYYVSDFLLKPLNFPRFADSINRVRRELMVTPSATALMGEARMILVKTGERNIKVRVDLAEIVYLEAKGRECALWLDNTTFYMADYSLKEMLQMLPKERFVRVHRSYAIAYHFIDRVLGQTAIRMRHIDQPIPLGSRRYYREYANWYEEHSM